VLQPSWQVPARRTLAGRGAWMIPLNRMVGASIDREPVRDASRIKLDFERVQFREERDQIVQAAPEAIDRPCHDYVEPAPGSVPVHGIEARTAIAALGCSPATL
jgi:hypothetical protein